MISLRALQLFFSALFLMCTSVLYAQDLQPFTSDGCSLFPDASLFSDKDWCNCCVTHDLAYWQGGTKQQRIDADLVFQQCMAQNLGPVVAKAMKVGLGFTGSPYLYTWFRWGYGWEYGRGYDPVTAEEEEQVEARLKEYYEGSPEATCGK